MIIENGDYTHEEIFNYVSSEIQRYLTDPDAALDTENGLSGELDYALQQVAQANTRGGDVQAAIDNVWAVFDEQFPSIF